MTPQEPAPQADNVRSAPHLAGCALCQDTGGILVLQTPRWRVIRAEEASFPAFYRLIWQGHVAEFSDLPAADRLLCIEVLTTIEQVLREKLSPTKINLASLGNVVPHLHWHVIARFDWDSHFPNPVWGQVLRQLDAPAASRLRVSLVELDAAVAAALMVAHPAAT